MTSKKEKKNKVKESAANSVNGGEAESQIDKDQLAETIALLASKEEEDKLTDAESKQIGMTCVRAACWRRPHLSRP